MIRGPVVAARIAFGADGEPPFAPDFGDRYHPAVGAAAQARHVFLAGNGLPARWAGRERFAIVETGFGLGQNFTATLAAWREDPRRCARLDYVAVEARPPSRRDLARVHGAAASLVAAWPPLVPGMHRLAFEGGRVRLLLAFGDVADAVPELEVAADAFFLDGFAPDRNAAMWSPPLLRALAHRAAPGATAATWSAARAVRDALAAAGFVVESAPGIGGKREISVARLRPGFAPNAAPPPPARALVVGAGLAGAFCARALADEGWSVRVVERRAEPAQEASGNVAGLFHGTVHADDGPHARWYRAAALEAARAIAPLVAAGRVPGSAAGLLRLGDEAAMRALVQRHGLPEDWVRVLDRDTASARAGVPLPRAAWFFPQGGWVAPQALVRAALEGLAATTNTEVTALARRGGAWLALDATGRVLAEAEAVVVAGAFEALRLLAPHAPPWPLAVLRGQVTGWRGAPVPLALPVAGGGYALPLADGVLCGATHSGGDDPAPSDADDAANAATLTRLTGLVPEGRRFSRVGFRVAMPDRLPLAGAVPQPAGDPRRRWPAVEGLWVCSALGGRGITSAPLAGRLVAAQVAGAAWPVERSLAAALGPARPLVRAARRGR